MTRTERFAIGLAVCALAATASAALAAEGDEKAGKFSASPRTAGKHDHQSPPAAERRADQPQTGAARMSRSPAPASGSMPKGGAAPSGKLGTEPAARGRLGTDPKPGESSKPPPRLN